MSDKSVIAKFNAEMFGKASYFCSRHGWRRNLHGVYIFRSDFGGVHLVATNAYHIVFFYDEDGYSNLDELYIPINNEFTKFSRKAGNKNNNIEISNVKKEVEEDLKSSKHELTFFEYIFNRLYFSVVTGCLLGYGDIYPETLRLKGFVALQALTTLIIIVL